MAFPGSRGMPKVHFPSLSRRNHHSRSLSLSHSLSVGLQLFCKEVPSNRVLNVKFKWQSSSNEMMLGAGNWKPEFADGSATGIVVPPRLHFMICEFVANLQLLL